MQEIIDTDVDKMEEEIKRTEEAIEDNLRRRAEQAEITVAAEYGTLGRRQSWRETSYHGC
jgi:hypothetical protein